MEWNSGKKSIPGNLIYKDDNSSAVIIYKKKLTIKKENRCSDSCRFVVVYLVVISKYFDPEDTPDFWFRTASLNDFLSVKWSCNSHTLKRASIEEDLMDNIYFPYGMTNTILLKKSEIFKWTMTPVIK